MARLLARQRQPALPGPDPDTKWSDRYSKEDKRDRSGAGGDDRKASLGFWSSPGWFLSLLALGFFCHMSAASNIIHDCDEVFNYWEPLHYLLYKSKFRTWEYRQWGMVGKSVRRRPGMGGSGGTTRV